MITVDGIEAKQYFVTLEGLEELRQYLDQLNSSRSQLAQELHNLTGQNDISSAMYDQAQTLSHTHVSDIDRQINRIKRILASAKVVGKFKTTSVDIGSSVVIEIAGKRRTYKIVGSIEVDPVSGKISNESPLGKSLMGKRAGDSLTLSFSGKQISAIVISVS